jgi:hypothetical protein
VLLAREFWSEYRAATTYYEKSRGVYGATSTLPVAEMERVVLDAMIEEALIRGAVRREAGADASHLISARVDSFLGDTELLQAADAAYGVDAAAFRALVLVPQAEREILTGQLFLRGEKLQDWLKQAKRDEQIRVFTPGFRWSGEEVEVE